MYLIWFLFLFTYIFVNYYISNKIYNSSKKFYEDKFLDDTNISIHEKFNVFRRNDNLSFMKIFFGMNFLFWWRFILSIFIVISYGIIIKFILLKKDYQLIYINKKI